MAVAQRHAEIRERDIGVTTEGFRFTRIIGDSGAERFILRLNDVSIETKFTQLKSIALLREAGLEPANDLFREIPLLGSDKKLQNALTNNGMGNSWYWTERVGLGETDGVTKSGELYIIKDGKFRLGQGRSVEKTMRIWPGNQPVWVLVLSDVSAADYGGRFDVIADDRHQGVASVVWGVGAGHEMAAPKIGVSPAEEGVKLTGITPEMLSALRENSQRELSRTLVTFNAPDVTYGDLLPETQKLIAALKR